MPNSVFKGKFLPKIPYYRHRSWLNRLGYGATLNIGMGCYATRSQHWSSRLPSF